MTRHESEQRVARLQAELKAKGIDGALIVYPIDVYYFSGTRQNSILWIPAEGTALLLVRKSVSRGIAESLIGDTRPFPSSKEFRALIGGMASRIGLTYDVLPVQQYEYYAKLLDRAEFVDVSMMVRMTRSVKSDWEIERIRQSGAHMNSVFRQVPEFLKAGMRELDLAAEVECRIRKAGSEGYTRLRAFNQEIFQGLAVSGSNAGTPGFFDGPVSGVGLSRASSHGASRATIRRGEPVLIDYTGVFEGYLVDMARMYVVGTLEPDLMHAFDVSLLIQNHLASGLRPGAMCDALFAEAVGIARDRGLEDHFMGVPGENAKFVGHGIGLELDELPVIAQGFRQPLASGQTIAIEPKFVFPGRGAVGIENTFVVTGNGGMKVTDIDDGIVQLD